MRSAGQVAKDTPVGNGVKCTTESIDPKAEAIASTTASGHALTATAKSTAPIEQSIGKVIRYYMDQASYYGTLVRVNNVKAVSSAWD